MNKTELLDKRTKYETLKAEIIEKDYTALIESEVEEYKAKVVAKYEAERTADLVKVNHYIELLEELIAEAEIVVANDTIEETAE